MTAPTCFISYSWDSDAHKDWVRKLADELCNNGVDTRLDQWDVYPGIDLTTYMETCVGESDFVLLICTPTFAQKANKGKGGVGYEKAIVTGEIFEGSPSPKKFVPILRAGDARDSLPGYLKSRAYLDFRDDTGFQINLEQLLRHIYESPLYARPPLGSRPIFNKLVTTPTSPGVVPTSVPKLVRESHGINAAWSRFIVVMYRVCVACLVIGVVGVGIVWLIFPIKCDRLDSIDSGRTFAPGTGLVFKRDCKGGIGTVMYHWTFTPIHPDGIANNEGFIGVFGEDALVQCGVGYKDCDVSSNVSDKIVLRLVRPNTQFKIELEVYDGLWHKVNETIYLLTSTSTTAP